jgi:general secretion pathway protein G
MTEQQNNLQQAMQESPMTTEIFEQADLHAAPRLTAQPERLRSIFARGLVVRNARGMTLIEILVVLAIIGLVMGGIAVVAFNMFEDAKPKAAAKDIANLSQSIEMYQLQKGKCPKSVQDLKAAGIIARVTKDPWGQDYVIKCPGEHGTAADIFSPGKDGEAGNEDDINSWDDSAEAAPES